MVATPGSSSSEGGRSKVTTILIFIVVLAMGVVSLSYAEISLRKLKNRTDSTIKKAHHYIAWGRNVEGTSFTIFIVFIIIAIITGMLFSPTSGSIMYLFYIMFILSLTASGVLYALGAEYLREAHVDQDEVSFKNAIIAASFSLGTIIGLILLTIITHKIKQAEALKAAKADADNFGLELETINDLKMSGVVDVAQLGGN